MGRAGRPPKPLEDHRRTGTFNATRHGQKSALAVVVEPVAPVAPFDQGPAEALTAVLEDGVHWLARTDTPALSLLRELLEERAIVRAGALAGSTEDRKALRDIDKQVISLMSELGFNPAARSRLGLAEVKAKSKLEELRERQARNSR